MDGEKGKLFYPVLFFCVLFLVSGPVAGLETFSPDSFVNDREIRFSLDNEVNKTWGMNITVEVNGENHTAKWNGSEFITESFSVPGGSHTATYYKNASRSETYSFTVDVSSPEVNIYEPDEEVFQDDFNVNGTWSDTNLVDGNISFADRVENGNFTVNASNYSEGDYQVLVEAVDKAGNRNRESKTVYIDRSKPEFQGLEHDGENVSGEVVKNGDILSIVARDEGSKVTVFLYRWSDDGDWNSAENGEFEVNVSEGSYDLDFSLKDLAGYWRNGSTVYNVTVDNTPPETVYSGFPGSWTRSAGLKLNCSGANSWGAIYESGERLEGWEDSLSYEINGHGIHTLNLRCRDEAGNVNDSVERAVKIDRRKPEIELKNRENFSEFDSFSSSIRFDLSDPGSGFNDSAVQEKLVNASVEEKSWNSSSGNLIYNLRGIWPNSTFTLGLEAVDRVGWSDESYYVFKGAPGIEVPIEARTREVKVSMDSDGSRVDVEESRKDILNLSFSGGEMLETVSLKVHSVSGNASVSVEEMKPKEVDQGVPGAEVYRYASVDPVNFSYGAGSTLSFSVDRSWIDEVNNSDNRLQVYHRVQEEWRNVSYSVLERSPESLVVQTRVNSFSMFAVGFEGNAGIFTLVLSELTEFSNWLTFFFLSGIVFSVWYTVRKFERPEIFT